MHAVSKPRGFEMFASSCSQSKEDGSASPKCMMQTINTYQLFLQGEHCFFSVYFQMREIDLAEHNLQPNYFQLKTGE